MVKQHHDLQLLVRKENDIKLYKLLQNNNEKTFDSADHRIVNLALQTNNIKMRTDKQYENRMHKYTESTPIDKSYS